MRHHIVCFAAVLLVCGVPAIARRSRRSNGVGSGGAGTKHEEGSTIEEVHETSSDRHDGQVFQGQHKDTAVVFSWHVGNAESDVRWGDDAVGGRGNLFKAAVLSVRQTHPDMPIYLFTNGAVLDEDTRNSITLVRVDLAREAGLNALLSAPNADAKVGFGTKLQSILTGESRAPSAMYLCITHLAFAARVESGNTPGQCHISGRRHVGPACLGGVQPVQDGGAPAG